MNRNRVLTLMTLLFVLCSSFSSRAAGFNTLFSADPDPAALAGVLYEELNLDSFGLQKEALEYAVEGYENLLDQGVVSNPQYLTIVDYSQTLLDRRFYLLDMENRELVLNTYVMHGRNSGGLLPDQFSNALNSNQSSLGFYLTGNPYQGSRGYSLRLLGQEPGFNTNALPRGVVLHGSN